MLRRNISVDETECSHRPSTVSVIRSAVARRADVVCWKCQAPLPASTAAVVVTRAIYQAGAWFLLPLPAWAILLIHNRATLGTAGIARFCVFYGLILSICFIPLLWARSRSRDFSREQCDHVLPLGGTVRLAYSNKRQWQCVVCRSFLPMEIAAVRVTSLCASAWAAAVVVGGLAVYGLVAFGAEGPGRGFAAAFCAVTVAALAGLEFIRYRLNGRR